MYNIVFSKYSNQRNAQYQIRTDILQDELGNRKIRKKALTKEAKQHIERIYNSYIELDKFYDSELINIPKCNLIDDEVKIDYVTGITLVQIVDKLYDEKKYDDIISIFKEYKKRISTNKIDDFTKSVEFINIFGDINIPEKLDAIGVSDIDIILDNIIIDDTDCRDLGKQCINKSWSIIDYEWTFSLKIPVNFILYRALLFYGLRSDKHRNMIQELDLYHIMGISENEIKTYEKMERAFSSYVSGQYVHLDSFNTLIGNKRYNIPELLVDKEKEVIEVYYDYGEGYSPAEVRKILPSVDKVSTEIVLEVKEDVKSIRIDPSSKMSIVNCLSIYGFNGAYYELQPITNGIMLDKQTLLFKTEDPQIIISELKEGTTKVTLSISISQANINIVSSITDIVDRLKSNVKNANESTDKVRAELKEYKTQYGYAIQQRDDLRRQVIEVENRCHELQTSYNIVTNSTAWKITKPARVTLDKVKNLLRKNPYTKLACKGVKNIKNNGIKFTLKKVKQYRNSHSGKLQYIEDNKLSLEEIKKQKEYQFSKDIKFSVIVPLYNTPKNFLREMIDSCINQTYGNWELCLADGSDSQHSYVSEIVQEYIKADNKSKSKLDNVDSRIKYKHLEANGGISENTNACIEMATGDYIALFDHDDVLHPSALYEYMKVICDKDADFIYCDEDKFDDNVDKTYDPYFKPDFAPDNLRANNYICHFTVFKKSLLDQVGMFRKEFDGSQDHDMIFRLTEKAKNIVHVPKVLYHWRVSKASVASDPYAKPYTIKAGIKAVEEHLQRIGLEGTVESSPIHPNTYRIRYKISGNPLISIIIPNKDHIIDLSRCINSIMKRSTYKNYEIIVIENNSTEEETFNYYKELEQYDNVKVVTYQTNDKFNYSAINNYGVQFASGEQFLFLNNDIEVISENWLEEMLMYSQRKDVGAVGAKLYYPNDTIQHAGVILGIGGVAGHSHKYFPRNEYGYFSKCMMVQDYSAVTAACLMMKASIFKELNGFDETFEVAFNDVDLCMRVRKAGYLIVYTPYAELYHYESISRGAEDTPEKIKRFQGEVFRFQSRWNKELEAGDPYYNPNLTLECEDFSFKAKGEK